MTTADPVVSPGVPTPNPRRIQLRRTKGWRKPEDAIVVSRPSVWGNPWKAGEDHPWYPAGQVLMSRQDAVDFYRTSVQSFAPQTIVYLRHVLAGHDLACWCPLDAPCHADVLLEIANPS